MKKLEAIREFLEKKVFSSSWILTPFNIALTIGLALYAFLDFKELFHTLSEIGEMDEQSGMMLILRLVDITMIAQLVKMIIDHKEKTSNGVLKVKMATSLIGVSSIHLLKTFASAESVTMDTITKQLYIHSTFVIGAVLLGVIDYLYVKAKMIHHEDECKHPHVETKDKSH